MGIMDELIDRRAIDALRAQLSVAAPDVDFTRLRRAARDVDGHKLRSRTDLVHDALLADLPQDYLATAVIVRRALTNEAFTGWAIWPVTEATTSLALESPDRRAFVDGLGLLAELTPRLTGEFAIRRFLDRDLDRALEVIATWTTHPDEHVRRLASEGTRPFLPWATRVRSIIERPDSTIGILDALHRDDSEYVRRSVANHLNDLSRNQAALAIELATSWAADADTNTRWVMRHGLRTLVKQAHPAALGLMGFRSGAVSVTGPRLHHDAVTMPGELVFELDIANDDDEPATLAVDYVVHYLKKNGLHSEKVFKLATPTLGPGESLRLTKRHGLRQMTTRVHHPGEHFIEAQVNGRRSGRVAFHVDT